MKKLLLALLVGLVLSSTSYALTFPNTTNKTSFQYPLVSSANNGNLTFVTGSQSTGAAQMCGPLSTYGDGSNTNGTLMSCGATPITGVLLSGGASGGTVTIYDSNSNVTASVAQGGVNSFNEVETGPLETVFEATVAANTTTFIDMHDVPLNTNNGVVTLASSTSGVIVYTGKGASNQ